MIKVFPTKKLVTAHIFRDSAGVRHMLSPAGSMESIGKVPQEFDGEDPLVAKKIMLRVKEKTANVSADDRKILKATLKTAADTEAEAEEAAPEKSESKALAKAEKAHGAAMEKASVKAEQAQAKAVEAALAEAGAAHGIAMENAVSLAVDDALAKERGKAGK